MIKHQLSKHPLYHVWGSMKRRCYNSGERAYRWYGALGITVCAEWLDNFKAFYDWAMANGYKKGLTIERSNNKLGYSPKNCTWIERNKQNKNRKNSYQIKYNGEVKNLSEWCELLGFRYQLVLQRLRLGWTFKRAISEPSSTPQAKSKKPRDEMGNFIPLPTKQKRCNHQYFHVHGIFGNGFYQCYKCYHNKK